MSTDDPRYQPPSEGQPGGSGDQPPSAPQYGAHSAQPGTPEQSGSSQPYEQSYGQPAGQSEQSYGQAGSQSYGQSYPPQDATSGGYAPTQQLGAGLAIASLVLGLLGLAGSWIVFPAFLGLIGIVLGIIALLQIRKGKARGKGLAIAGIITGVLSIIVAVAVAIFAALAINNSDIVQCMREAGQDQAKQQQCSQQFQESIPTGAPTS